MLSYSPPLSDLKFVLFDVLGVEQTGKVERDLVEAILDEAGRFATGVVTPLNQVGDRTGCVRHHDGSVSTPPGYREAYGRYVEAGWGTLALPVEHGGQGLPQVVATAVEEMLNSSCHAFNMYPGLTHGAVAALEERGSDALKAGYLAQLVSGEWLGTMALTEAHAGTDLGLLRTTAQSRVDGSFTITGEKIFCSGGEHDLTDNIVHLVLARVAGAPRGSRGVSLFLVPKVLPDGARNAVTCGAIEHKMGVHGSATCVMNFDGAAGWLIGAENEGLAAMFVMMNAARLSCGNQGLGQAELAYQNAVAYALERRQGRAAGSQAEADPLIVHPDIRRLLMDARAFTEGFRTLVLWTAQQIGVSHDVEEDAQRRSHADALVSLLTPVIKGYGTDRGFETAVAMQQVFGGHGYVAEWGMEQIVRDARAAMLYEGANGVQALDLVTRKLARDGGETAELLFAQIAGECDMADAALRFIAAPLAEAVHEARQAAQLLLSARTNNPDSLGAGSYAFMQLMGVLAVGWMWLWQARTALPHAGNPFHDAKLATARHYAERSLPYVQTLRRVVAAGPDSLLALTPDQFVRQG